MTKVREGGRFFIDGHIFQSVLDVSTHFVKQDLYCLTKKHDGGQFFSNLDLFIYIHSTTIPSISSFLMILLDQERLSRNFDKLRNFLLDHVA